jgi:hypothetical protein
MRIDQHRSRRPLDSHAAFGHAGALVDERALND